MIVYHGSCEIVEKSDVYDQIAFISQTAIDQLLIFQSYEVL